MIVNNINELIENYKQLKKSFKVRHSANYIELVTSTGQKIYQNKSKRFQGGLYLFYMVRKDVEFYLEKNGEVEPYRELPVNYVNKDFDYSKDTIGMDINNAYWSVALLKGYITQNTYEKGLEDKQGMKSIRLASLSSLGKSRIYNVYEDGEHISDEQVNKNERLQNVYLDIRYSTYGVMLEIAEELGDDFCSWKTDCVFFHDTFDNREKVRAIIESYGLECKIEFNKKLKPISL
jgi:hypothetical protein